MGTMLARYMRYQTGDGVSMYLEAVIYWFKKSAIQGIDDAMQQMVLMDQDASSKC